MALMPSSTSTLSWVGLIRSGLSYAQERGYITEAQELRQGEALASGDMDEMLVAAEFVGRKLSAPTGLPYARWMQTLFKDWKPEKGAMSNALRALVERKALIATLNYDLVADQATGLDPIVLADPDPVLAWCRKERDGILHLHGVFTRPETCVFGIRDYHDALSDEARNLLQRSLTSLNRILFIGCGDTLSDPNFSALIKWLRENVGAGAPQHYALVKSDEVAERMADPLWHGFVEPIAYGDNYSDLPVFLLDFFPTRSAKRPKTSRLKSPVDRHRTVVECYKAFTLRDCGEMTIEGMRADMDTAQRKFNLERLFVPLEVQAIPPAIPLTDENRDTKLQAWREKHGDAAKFAAMFSKHRKIALLALPGGGKTLLLKRLAVAYSDPKRRDASPDELPDLDLIPLMIRCREWKEHIRKPFWTLLQEISMITGDQSVSGLAEALQKPLKAGTVLLLVDGLDEIHDDGDRTIFVENLERFVNEYPKIRLLVTSREAGFDLVAPCVARFCEKFKIAPLTAEAISALSGHWHRLMSGSSQAAQSEAENVASALLAREPLRRLAENPLLLTMLLVVKHGAGRLPPDRVSLYDRAVEVLLDTWNIKGHDALDTKEAVPQLACLAFELMRRGAQTATEKEILSILVEARKQLHTIGRYAKDSPHDFLKRVELRSSLMLEGGHTSEGGKTVPFYQFRHLTFQEYLAAVAAVEGYILNGVELITPLDAIGKDLLAEEWKEIVPMAAVLARNRAGPLLEALVTAAEGEITANTPSEGAIINYKLPPATGCLAQAMIEEAVFPENVLRRATRLVTYFSDGLRTQGNYRGLSRGPYGHDLRTAALNNYITGNYVTRNTARNTLAMLEGLAREDDFWLNADSVSELISALGKSGLEDKVRAIAAVGGSFIVHRGSSVAASSLQVLYELERALFDERPEVHLIAVWCWGFWRHLYRSDRSYPPIPELITIERLVALFVAGFVRPSNSISFVVAGLAGVGRDNFELKLTDTQQQQIRAIYDDLTSSNGKEGRYEDGRALLRIAYLLPSLYTDDDLRRLVSLIQGRPSPRDGVHDILSYLGVVTQKPRRRDGTRHSSSRSSSSR